MTKGVWLPQEPGARRSPGRLLRGALFLAAMRTLPHQGVAVAGARRLWERPDDVITVGRHSYFDGVPVVHRYPGSAGSVIAVGAFSSIAKDVTFVLGGYHDPQRVTTSPVHKTLGGLPLDNGEISGRGGIVVGNDVWIGRGALVLDGARIGDGAVVGARAVVSGTVEPYAVVVGSPAQFVRHRFDPETVTRLRSSAWWDLSHETLTDLLPLLGSRDVTAFLDRVEGL